MSTTFKIIYAGLAAFFVFVLSMLASAIYQDVSRCTYPLWIELGDVDGGTLLAKTSQMRSAFHQTFKENHGTRVSLGEGGSVFVTESVADLKKKLCVGEE